MTVRRIALFDLDNTLTDHTTAFTLWATEFSGTTGVPVPWLMKAEERHDGARHHKPDPELFRLALDELQAHAGAGAAMVGDCLATDVEGGLRAGLHTVWVAGERARLPPDPMPTRTVQTVVEAADWLRTAVLSPARAPALTA
ncbi:HAD hydrolase-like protein [Streptomyces sp. NPDC002920]